MGLCFATSAGSSSSSVNSRGVGLDDDNPQRYCDADWFGDPVTRRSQTAYAFRLPGAAVSWSSSLQRTTAASAIKSEYQAAAAATHKARWLRKVPAHLGMGGGAITVWSDSQSALSVACYPICLPD